MKKLIGIMMCLCMLAVLVPTPVQSAGGAGPFFASCCLGPRIGTEYNEGTAIEVDEWLGLIIPRPIMAIFQGGSNNGFGGYMASCCLGPRVGEQLDKRKVRTLEWLYLVPFVNVVSAVVISAQAGQGQTMSQIESKEKLKK